MECSNKLKINEYVSYSQLKRRFKAHLIDLEYSEYKPSIFSKGLVLTLVMLLEEILCDCLKNIKKDNTTGLYKINSLILRNLLNEDEKYNYCNKYKNKYSSKIKYHESLFFNIYKVMNSIETKHGDKLMIDSEVRNMICYYLLCLQNELIELSLKVVKYSNKKTLNNKILLILLEHFITQDSLIRIKLKLDSSNISKDDDNEEEEESEEGESEEEEVEEEEAEE